MVVKKLQVTDMSSAVSSIAKEFGSDAVILSSKKTRKKGIFHLFSKPFYEIMVAYDPEMTPQKQKLNAIKSKLKDLSAASAAAEDVSGNANRFYAIEDKLGKLDLMLKRVLPEAEDNSEIIDEPGELAALAERLIENQVDPIVAADMCTRALKLLREMSEDTALDAAAALAEVIAECLGEPRALLRESGRRIIMLMGTTGVGKTTSLVKLAAAFLKEGKSVGIINADTYRAGAQKQLEIYSELLSVPLILVYEPEEIVEALSELSQCEVVLIDTAGINANDEAHRKFVQNLVELSRADDLLLTISASTSFAVGKAIIDSYAFLPDYALLITKVDEAVRYGNILNLRWYSGKPLTYIAKGQKIPDDLEIAQNGIITGKVTESL